MFKNEETYKYYFNNQEIAHEDSTILSQIISMIYQGNNDFVFAFEVIHKNNVNSFVKQQQIIGNERSQIQRLNNSSDASSPTKTTGKTIIIKYKNKILKIHVSDQQFKHMTILEFKQKVWDQIRSFHQDFLGEDTESNLHVIINSQTNNINNSNPKSQLLDYNIMELSYQDTSEVIQNDVQLNHLKNFNLFLKRNQTSLTQSLALSSNQNYQIIQSLFNDEDPENKLTRTEEINLLIDNEQEKIDQLNKDKIAKYANKNVQPAMIDEQAANNDMNLTDAQIEDQRFWNLVEILY